MKFKKNPSKRDLIKKIFFNNKMIYKTLKIKGSYTLEAIFIIPIVLGLIFAMIYVIFYLHDKTVFYCNMQQAVVHIAEDKKEYKDDEEWQQDMQENLWIFRVVSGTVNKDKLYIKPEATAECNINIPIIGYFIDSKQEIKTDGKYLAIHPEFIVRTKDILKS
ncbi:MAG: pilus assembly protein [Lachnospiraceae bacterium]|nr:pilus assembly protein [Lachnospiraceae bacterium]